MAVALSDLPVARLGLDEYHRLIEAGGFAEGHRIELIEGVLVEMSAKGEPQELALESLSYEFIRGLDRERYSVRTQSALTLVGSGSEPEPDLLVAPRVAPRPYHYGEALLVVEVAVSSLSYDRRVKSALYAPAVDEYWIVDVEGEAVEVRTQPAGREFRELRTARAGEVLVPAELGAPEIDVAELFAATRRR